MCDNCRDPPFSFRGDRHEVVTCPFKTSQYCSHCAIYGHSYISCPTPPSKIFTDPRYIEQLIPESVRKQYNITSNTLLPGSSKDVPKEERQGFLEITNDDKIIKAFLVSRGLIGPRTENSNILRLALMNYAKSENKRLVFL